MERNDGRGYSVIRFFHHGEVHIHDTIDLLEAPPGATGKALNFSENKVISVQVVFVGVSYAEAKCAARENG